METSMNDRWSRAAATAQERKADSLGFKPLKETETPVAGSALEIAGLTPEDVRKLAAKFGAAPVKAADKNGVPAAQLAGVVSTWILVTPEMARRWLQSNFRNRPLSDEVVIAYARDMAAGRWQPTHQGLAFNDRDQLIDGQHRLAAVLRHGKPVRMMVTFGLPTQIAGSEMTTMDCVDRGRTRTVADQLKIQHGLKHGALIASVAAAVGHLCVGERLRRLSVGQTLDVYRAFQPGMDYVIKHRSKANGLKSAAVLAAFAFVHGLPKTDVPLRFARLDSGEELTPALGALRVFLLQNESLVMMRNLHRGIVELVTHAIWLDMTAPATAALEMRPEVWLQAVEFFQASQTARVAKVAALFKLP